VALLFSGAALSGANAQCSGNLQPSAGSLRACRSAMNGRQMKSLVMMRMGYREKIVTIDFEMTALSFDADMIEAGMALWVTGEPQIMALQ
jgi:hypothetical protein